MNISQLLQECTLFCEAVEQTTFRTHPEHVNRSFRGALSDHEVFDPKTNLTLVWDVNKPMEIFVYRNDIALGALPVISKDRKRDIEYLRGLIKRFGPDHPRVDGEIKNMWWDNAGTTISKYFNGEIAYPKEML